MIVIAIGRCEIRRIESLKGKERVDWVRKRPT